MTANQVKAYPSTAMIPVPRFKLGELVSWNNPDQETDSHDGVVIQQNYRIDHNGGKWEFTMAITVSKRNGSIIDFYTGEVAFDIEESAMIHNDLLTDD
ncbi:MAG: hypothetical protein V7K55_11220 [Nostoc sp.]|uniref:hypothetical protein n=1 Tax=Nostoc sp. TaxID=1180 RepID=UPI002FF8751E